MEILTPVDYRLFVLVVPFVSNIRHLKMAKILSTRRRERGEVINLRVLQ
jgi:hypothetical protein